MILDDREAQAALNAGIAAAGDATPAWKVIGEKMISSTEETFTAQGRPDKWPALAESTVNARLGGKKRTFTERGTVRLAAKKKLGSMKTLVHRGRLLRSITARASGSGVKWGSNVIYARIHQFGGKAGRGKSVEIPARPYIQFLPEDEKAAVRALVEYIEGAISKQTKV